MTDLLNMGFHFVFQKAVQNPSYSFMSSTYDDDFPFEFDSGFFFHYVLDVGNQTKNILRAGVSFVDDEIGMLEGNAGLSDTVPFESRRFDQSPGAVVGWIFKDRSRVGNGQGLFGTSSLQVTVHGFMNGLHVTFFKLQLRFDNDSPC